MQRGNTFSRMYVSGYPGSNLRTHWFDPETLFIVRRYIFMISRSGSSSRSWSQSQGHTSVTHAGGLPSTERQSCFVLIFWHIWVSRFSLTISPPVPLRLYTLPYWSNPSFLIFDIRALWRSRRTERQSARMSKIKNGALDQYGAEPFEQQQFGTAGIEGVIDQLCYCRKFYKKID